MRDPEKHHAAYSYHPPYYHFGEEATTFVDYGPQNSTVETYLNQLNEALQARLEVSGELFLSNAVIEGRYLLRACIVNFRTSSKDIAEIPGIISRHGKQADEELQQSQSAPVSASIHSSD